MKPRPERRILGEGRPASLFLAAAIALGFLAAVLFALQAILLSGVVNRVFLLGQSLENVVPLLALMAGLLLLRAGMIWAGDITSQRAASRIKRALREKLTAHLLALGPAYTRGERSGELTHTTVEGVEALDEYIAQYLPALVLAVLAPAMVLLLIFSIDPPTVLVLVIAGPFLVLLLALIGGRAKAITDRRFVEMSWMSAHFLDMLQGLPTLKMFGRSKEQGETIAEISRHYGNTTMDVLRTAFQTSLVMEWAATAATAFVAFVSSLRLMNGELSFERALAVILLTPEFFLPLRQMALKYHAGTAGKAAAARIYAILDTPLPATPAAARATPSLARPSTYEIAYSHISFAYDSGKRPALHDVSFTMKAGETVALVGATGAGKSTLAQLLLRFIQPNAGAILINGQPLDQFEVDAWRAAVAWVPQSPHLFHGSIADNLRIARPDASMDELVAAAREAHADEFICVMPMGYDTQIGEGGVRLSGGQRQRLAIARAFLKRAPVLILDEPTSHLDAENEAMIQDALNRLRRGCTTLVISHRLMLAQSADQVVVLDGGRVVEAGAPAMLAKQDRVYQQMLQEARVS